MNSAWMVFKAEVIAQYQEQKQMAEAALGRVSDATFFTHLQEQGVITPTAWPFWSSISAATSFHALDRFFDQ